MACDVGLNDGPATIGALGGVVSLSRTSRTELVTRLHASTASSVYS